MWLLQIEYPLGISKMQLKPEKQMGTKQLYPKPNKLFSIQKSKYIELPLKFRQFTIRRNKISYNL